MMEGRELYNTHCMVCHASDAHSGVFDIRGAFVGDIDGALEEVPAILDIITEIKAGRKRTILLVEHKFDMIMLSVAIGWSISQKFDTVAYAAHGGDHAIYPDCREEFAEAMDRAAACWISSRKAGRTHTACTA